MNMLLFIPQKIGHEVILFLSFIGKFTFYIIRVLSHLFLRPFYFGELYKQSLHIGFFSLPLVSMTAIFSGAVLALQSYSGFSRFSAENSIPIVVVLSITRELGPVLAGLMVAARSGAAMAAEIATMKVAEQVDALYTLLTHPFKFLILPRVIATAISLPLLVVVSDVIGVLGGYLVGVYKLEFNAVNYIENTFKYLYLSDVILGIVKAFIFGLIIAFISSFYGYYCDKGAKGVGISTTKAVVISSILILISNYFITEIFVSN